MASLAILLLLATSLAYVSACPSHNHTTTAGNPLQRRWFGIPTLPSDGNYAAPYFYPWPATCSNPIVQPVRYCYKDKRSSKNLNDIVQQAIAGWSPAWTDGTKTHSALRIIPDPGCGDAKYCLCSDPNVAKDALVISDETRGNDHDWNDGPDCQTVTTTGYHYIANGEPDAPFRHYLKFCAYDPTDNNRQKPKAVLIMKHEIGHVIGLSHEHQRPGRDKVLWYQPKNIMGIVAATERCRIDAQAHFEDDMSLDLRVKMAGQRGPIAKDYFHEALEYVMSSFFQEGYDETAAMYEAWEASDKFDYDSIMMYSSDTGAIASGKKIIFRKDNKQQVYMGGNPDVAQAGISEGDVARVAQLYDSKTAACERAKKGEVWGKVGSGPSKLKVKVRGEEIIVSTPGHRGSDGRNEL